MLSNLRRALTDPPLTADAYARRILIVALWTFLVGPACGIAAMALLFAWVATGDSVLMTAVRWLIRAAWACLAVVAVCAVLIHRHRRRQVPDRDI